MKQKRLGLVLLLLAVMTPIPALAQSSSPNYQVEEAIFGTGGDVDMTSSSYQAQSSVGPLGVGSVSSATYDAEAGFLSSSEPFLAMVVDGADVNLGTLTTSTTAFGSSSFNVRTYLSSGYIVVTLSQPPVSEGGASLDPMSTTAAPSVGTEQFGINLVDNSSPDTGANPINVPDDTFADGEAATGYATPNQFKYAAGNTVARSAKTSGNQAVGRTDYTISYIANISPITPAGSYSMGHDLVAIATY